ncbi:MAG: WcbI family polysaccharide biosynthesis putative acetyltransferase [Pseudomonadota bacterium]
MQILVVANCAAGSYRRILSCFLPYANVRSASDKRLRDQSVNLDAYDVVIALQSAANWLAKDMTEATKLIKIPGFFFSGYHPDTIYVTSTEPGSKNIRSAAGPYHSMICAAAFKAGMSVDEALSFYTANTYTALDYFGEYERSKERFLTSFAACDMDMSQALRRWSRKGCFMHSINHPKSECFVDVMRTVCRAHFPDFLDFDHPLPDLLSESMIFPCYPEIGQRRGTTGSYVFKKGGEFEMMNLHDFVSGSFAEYEKIGREKLKVAGPFRKKFDVAYRHIAGV